MAIKLISLWKTSMECKMKTSKHLICNKKLIINQTKTSMQICSKQVVLSIMDIKILMNRKMISKILMVIAIKISRTIKRNKNKKAKSQNHK